MSIPEATVLHWDLCATQECWAEDLRDPEDLTSFAIAARYPAAPLISVATASADTRLITGNLVFLAVSYGARSPVRSRFFVVSRGGGRDYPSLRVAGCLQNEPPL